MQMGLYVVIVFKTDAIKFQSKTMVCSVLFVLLLLLLWREEGNYADRYTLCRGRFVLCIDLYWRDLIKRGDFFKVICIFLISLFPLTNGLGKYCEEIWVLNIEIDNPQWVNVAINAQPERLSTWACAQY